jgi:hypothetical protein
VAATTFTIEPDELLGLNALIALGKAADGGHTEPGTESGTQSPADDDAVAEARTLMRLALAEKLSEAGLPWAPSDETVSERVAKAAKPATAFRRLAENKKLRRSAGYALLLAVLVVLWGGYVEKWSWTGFQENRQLWDWLQLLLLPFVAASVPLWIQYGTYIGRARTVVYGAVLAAWTGFVIAGYLIPLPWTGFQGQTLWNWFELLLLPIAVACTVALVSRHIHPVNALRMLRPHHKVISAAVGSGWVVTVIGGYGLQWAWTGYSGNTLWDWFQLLLLPLVFPTILLPALLRWVTGNASERARKGSEVPPASQPSPLSPQAA